MALWVRRFMRPRSFVHERTIVVGLLLLLWPLTHRGAQAEAAKVDRAFGFNGTVTYSHGSYNGSWFGISDAAGQPNAMAIDRRDRILVAGGTNDAILVVRYLPSGKLDNSFGASGAVQFDSEVGRTYGPKYNARRVQTMNLLPNGKILLTFMNYMRGGPAELRLLRLNPNGAIDTSFSKKGKPSGLNVFPKDGDVLADGSILLSAQLDRQKSNRNPKPDLGALLKFDATGEKVLTFGSGHKGFATFVPRNRLWSAVVYDAFPAKSGKVVVSGFNDYRMFLSRLMPNGKLDRTFGPRGSGGIVSSGYVAPAGPGLIGGQAVRAPSGDIIQIGYPRMWNARKPDRLILVKRHANGALDLNFGNDGMVALPATGWIEPHDLTLQNNGRILVALRKASSRKSLFGVFRFLPNGSLDRSFFGDGRYFTTAGGKLARADEIAIDSKGRAVVAGGVAKLKKGSSSQFEPGAFLIKRFLLG